MRNGLDLKGRDFEYVGPLHEHEPGDLPCICPEPGHRATVLDVRVDGRSDPIQVLIRSQPDGLVTWMAYGVFSSWYAQILPAAPVKRTRRAADPARVDGGDHMDALWGQVMKDVA